MSLTEYKAKRDFRQTTEPTGERLRPPEEKNLRFVVQKHAASSLHYDFRLELDGVLKSWAIPKGLPTIKGRKHLAIHVEDHPVTYTKFEGTIPEGNYGAGTVMVWDLGQYRIQGNQNPQAAFEAGKIPLYLEGKKLKGVWTLIRTRRSSNGEKDQWLIFKTGENAAAITNEQEDRSVLSNRTMAQISGTDMPRSKQRHTITTQSKSKSLRNRTASRRVIATRASDLSPSQAKTAFVEPMKCLLVDDLPTGSDWVYEVKFDGVRALAIKQGGKSSLISRNAKVATEKYPEIAQAIGQLRCKDVILDGEVVAVDPEGRSSFQLLQSYYMQPDPKRPPIFYYAFDIIRLNGKDLTALPLMGRKEILKTLLKDAPSQLMFSAPLQADADRLMKEMSSRGLEGLIAKQRNSKYEIGQRTGAWVKFKWTNEQEFVIGGFTSPKGARTHFGAILLGYYENGQFRFASKVGTGFNRKILDALHRRFQKLIQKECPFTDLPERRTGRTGQGMTAAKMKECTWLKPKLVCQIRFSEWTRDGHLRQPVYLGLREDKKPEEVIRESPQG